ncbi:Na+/H+ antiporter NhaC family protein, partial [Staphylococcus aureus]|uniref:Na+/H+ antiporter NhaC family protein n=1 Tax=Staphylococcus aureus TaxID=1280 RepID=UPI0037DA1296
MVIIILRLLIKDFFQKYQLSPSLLSTTLEHSTTILLPLIPSGTSPIYYTNQLHLSLQQFFISTVPSYLCPIIAIIYRFTRIRIKNS